MNFQSLASIHRLEMVSLVSGRIIASAAPESFTNVFRIVKAHRARLRGLVSWKTAGANITPSAKFVGRRALLIYNRPLSENRPSLEVENHSLCIYPPASSHVWSSWHALLRLVEYSGLQPFSEFFDAP
jgi:hypothetical protein